MSLFDLGGKVALVTGSSRGIGRAIVEALADQGAKVVVSSRKAEACAEVVAAIAAKGGHALAIPCNIAHKDQIEALVDGTLAHWGRIDVLVCNAAVNPFYGPLSQIPDVAFDRTLGTNIRSNLWLCNRVLPQMAERKDGSVIIISSIVGFQGTGMIGAYAIAKAADLQLARNLSVEWGKHGIRVNAICPGIIRTDFSRALWENAELVTATEKLSPLGRLGEPEDLAGAAVFLASPASRYVTGATLVVDGGVTSSSAM